MEMAVELLILQLCLHRRRRALENGTRRPRVQPKADGVVMITAAPVVVVLAVTVIVAIAALAIAAAAPAVAVGIVALPLAEDALPTLDDIHNLQTAITAEVRQENTIADLQRGGAVEVHTATEDVMGRVQDADVVHIVIAAERLNDVALEVHTGDLLALEDAIVKVDAGGSAMIVATPGSLLTVAGMTGIVIASIATTNHSTRQVFFLILFNLMGISSSAHTFFS
eukprot:scpid36661/ scgid3093/ 